MWGTSWRRRVRLLRLETSLTAGLPVRYGYTVSAQSPGHWKLERACGGEGVGYIALDMRHGGLAHLSFRGRLIPALSFKVVQRRRGRLLHTKGRWFESNRVHHSLRARSSTVEQLSCRKAVTGFDLSLAANAGRRSRYNRNSLVAGLHAFATGERQRAASKRCSICKDVKAAIDFYKSNTNKDGLHGWCKVCSDRRTVENGRKRLLGLTPEAYQSLLEAQGRKCAICETEEPTAGKRSFSADHNHKTGAVRGLLCTRCNTMLGNALDDPTILRAAISYLERHR